MDWHEFVKKYVWDETKTPYFTKVPDLTRLQARHETFIYAFFLGTTFLVVTLAAIADVATNERLSSILVALYGGGLFVGALVIGLKRHLHAAIMCVSAPIAVFLYFLISGFPPRLGTIDKYVLLGFCLLWLWYTVRIVAIAKRYPQMSDPGRKADDGSDDTAP